MVALGSPAKALLYVVSNGQSSDKPSIAIGNGLMSNTAGQAE